MVLRYRAAVLHAPQTPLSVETVTAASLKPTDVLVRIRAAGLCHTDLEVIEGSLRYPLPIVLGHEAAGVVEQAGTAARGVKIGDHVVLSWNPHCGHCFYCDRACLIGCGVMTGVGAALNLGAIAHGDTVMVIGCGAVGLAAVQGARLAGAGAIIAVDLDPAKLALAARMGATHGVNASTDDVTAAGRRETGGRGVDVVIESAGSASAFRTTPEAVRPGGQVIWLGKIDVNQDVSFRWGSLMQEKAHPPRQLRQRAAAPRFSAARASLSRRLPVA